MLLSLGEGLMPHYRRLPSHAVSLDPAPQEAGTTIKPGSRVASLQASPLTPPKPHPQAHSTGGKTKKGKGQATLPETTAFDVNHEAGSNEHLAVNMGLHVLLGGLKCGMCADIAVKAVGLVTDTLLLEKLLDVRTHHLFPLDV